ncbi:hypothetical protein [Micromonospora coxensis]|uniref:ApeA N-terminal domain 1-containing protein n=1 Tax=Micromonospora coxensis TaxID=356852 RepID=UPI00342639F0
MAEGVPLKPRLEPGQYRGRWSVPDETGALQHLDGDLDLPAGRPPSVSVVGRVPLQIEQGDGFTSASFPQRFTHPLIVGQLRNGPKVLLLDVEVQSWHNEQAFINARAALVGTPRAVLDGPMTFDTITTQITGLDAYAGIGPIKSFTFPADAQGFYEHPWQVEPNPDSTQTWTDEHATVTISWPSTIAQEIAFFRMAFSPLLTIELTQPLDFDDCLEQWIEPLRRIISLATGRTEDITFLSVSRPVTDDHHDDFQVYGHKLDQVPFATRDTIVRKIRTAFRANTERLSPLQLLRAWQARRDERHPLLETYGASIVLPRQHPRSTYLLLIQALEGLYGHEHQAEHDQSVTAHMTRRDEALAALTQLPDLPAHIMKFLKKYLMRKPHSSLDKCLDEMFNSLPYDVRDELNATTLVQQVKQDAGKPLGLPEALRIVRNGLSHGTKGYPTQDLHAVVQILDRVTRAHMLRVLGCGADAQSHAARGDRM